MQKKAVSILLAILTSAVISASASPETDYIDEQLASIQVEFNVQVHYQYNTNLFFPPEWQIPALALSATGIDTAEVTRLIPIIRQFLSAHPVAVIRAELDNIYLLKDLRFRGKLYGGTHRDRSVYIISSGETHGYTTEHIVCRLHSEFSSILMDHYPFAVNGWNQLNPEGFTYSGNGFEMVDSPCWNDYAEHLREQGFLVIYSRSSLENDVNMIASWLFTRKAQLDSVSQQYDKIRQKQAMVEQFYMSINGEYSFN